MTDIYIPPAIKPEDYPPPCSDGFFYLVYKITNNLDNKFYIGIHKAKNPRDDYYGSGICISRALKKYGKENFTKEILFFCDSTESMQKKEQEIVTQELIDLDECYNLAPGGAIGWNASLTPERRKELQALNGTMKRLWADPVWIKKKAEISSVSLSNRWKDPTFRANQLRLITERSNNPEIKTKLAENLRKKVAERYNGVDGEKNRELARVKLQQQTIEWRKDKDLMRKRHEKIGKRVRNSIWINDGETQRRLTEGLPIPTGWVRGMLWNSGMFAKHKG